MRAEAFITLYDFYFIFLREGVVETKAIKDLFRVTCLGGEAGGWG